MKVRHRAIQPMVNGQHKGYEFSFTLISKTIATYLTCTWKHRQKTKVNHRLLYFIVFVLRGLTSMFMSD